VDARVRHHVVKLPIGDSLIIYALNLYRSKNAINYWFYEGLSKDFLGWGLNPAF
jgi:hypothetical protein